jgi:ubiquinone/menaquinone biosynthesis C-methylase UbiE
MDRRDDTTAAPIDAEAVAETALRQFTVDAESFSRSVVANDRAALDALAELAAVQGGDTVLDLACGPGIVSCDLAARGATVLGVDLTPAMLTAAEQRATEAGVSARCRFVIGRMERVEKPEGGFDVVVSRYALHHAAQPAAVAAEMARLVRPGGRIVVFDFAASDDRHVAAAYDDAERRRDPSHVRNLTALEQRELFAPLGFAVDAVSTYRVVARLEAVLARSHGTDHDGVRRAFAASLDLHGLGVGARREDNDITFAYPIVGHRFVRAAAGA